jgi:hypothetical protein
MTQHKTRRPSAGSTSAPPDLFTAATRLVELLAEENAALAAADIPRAIRLVEAKSAALAGLQATLPLTRSGSAPPSGERRRDAEALALRLQHEMSENRALLERALHVQHRIIEMIARAMPRALAANAPRYGSKGSIHSQDIRRPVAVSAKA